MKILLCCILAVISISQAIVPLGLEHPRSKGYIHEERAPVKKTDAVSGESDQPVREKFSNMLQDVSSYLKFLESEPRIDVSSALSVVNDLVKIHSSRILSSMGGNLDTRNADSRNRAMLPEAKKDDSYIPSESELTHTVNNLLGSIL